MNKIESLDGIKALAFIGIMIAHAGVRFLPLGAIGSSAVSVFLILNGFLMSYNYYNRIDEKNETGIIDNFMFMKRKIGNLYPLHLFTLCAMLFLDLVGTDREPIIYTFLTFVLNAMLVEEWFPLAYKIRFANGVSWFLCTFALANFIFLWVFRWLKKQSKRNNINLIILSIVIQVILGVGSSFFPELPYSTQSVWDNRLTVWLVYYFPLSRFLDIFIGYNLGIIYHRSDKSHATTTNATIKELVVVFIYLLVILFSNYYRVQADNAMPEYNHPKIWWSTVAVFTIPTIMLIWTFVKAEGRVSSFLKDKRILFLAGISSYGFLIHYVVFSYLFSLISHINGGIGIKLNKYKDIVCVLIGIPLTIICSFIWKKIMLGVKNKRNNKTL